MSRFFNFKLLSLYRKQIYGISIISIVIFHYFETLLTTEVQGVFFLVSKAYVYALGSVGVDLFLFLSGVGIYQSLKNDPSVGRFYSKRFSRVVIPYILIGSVFWIVKDIILGRGEFGFFLWDFSLLSFWTDGKRTLWYVALIIVLYLLSPFFLKIKSKIPYDCIVIPCTAVLGCIVCYYLFPRFFANCEIGILRIPIYLIGFFNSDFFLTKDRFQREDLALFLFIPIDVFCYVLDSPFSRFGDGLFSILFGLAMGNLLFRLNHERSGRIFRTITFLGEISFELYLSHVCVRNLLISIGFDLTNILVYFSIIIICILYSLFIHKIVSALRY